VIEDGHWQNPLKRRAALKWAFLLFVVAAAFILRVWGLSKVHFWDEAVYLQNAEVICCDKHNYSELDSRPPLLSLIFAAVFSVWHSIYAADIATALMNALAPALLYLSGRMVVGRIPAAIASLLLAFAPFFVGVFPNGFDSDNTGNSLLADSPTLTILLLAFWLLLCALRHKSQLRFASAGFVFALAVLMRFACFSTVAVLSLLALEAGRYRWRAVFACAGGFLAGIMPYLCWSRLRYGGFFETVRRGWRYYQGERVSPLFYARHFGTMFCWITLVGLVLWVGRWAWQMRTHLSLSRTESTVEQGELPTSLEWFLWFWAGFVIVVFFTLPHQEPRYLMPAAPPLFLLAGSGLSVLLPPRQIAIRTAGSILIAAGLFLSFLPDVQRFRTRLFDNTISEEMQVSKFLNENVPQGTILYSNFNYPVFGYYTNLPVHELPETGPRLYDALNHLPHDGILIAYSKAEISPDPKPEWLHSNAHFRVFREFPSIVLYRYQQNAER
jgi:4-amino-4-deoxy-L-arabinose transferase-like glycosyltransferase